MTPAHGAPAAPALRRLYWETTAGCNLRCIHCRRIDASDRVSPDELNTDQAFGMIDDLASMGKPVLILSGGEPLFRRDIFDIAAYASGRGLPVALSTNGTLVNAALARKARESGVYYASVSLDGARAATHDRFRGEGRFEMALNGIARLKEAGLKVQINFTLTNKNRHEPSSNSSACE
jgi:MoaA/NifB/PqqE/SkfB family radical SAM enzyme